VIGRTLRSWLAILYGGKVDAPIAQVVLVDSITFIIILIIDVAISRVSNQFRNESPYFSLLATTIEILLSVVALAFLAQAFLLILITVVEDVIIVFAKALRRIAGDRPLGIQRRAVRQIVFVLLFALALASIAVILVQIEVPHPERVFGGSTSQFLIFVIGSLAAAVPILVLADTFFVRLTRLRHRSTDGPSGRVAAELGANVRALQRWLESTSRNGGRQA
jgi:hypothetical protein